MNIHFTEMSPNIILLCSFLKKSDFYMTRPCVSSNTVMNSVTGPIAELSFDEKESILHVRLLRGAVMTIETAKQYDSQIREITSDKPYLALIDFSDLFMIDQEALKFVSTPGVIKNRLAAAYYNPNLANRITVEAFRKLGNPSFPVKLFKTKKEAIEWLKKQL